VLNRFRLLELFIIHIFFTTVFKKMGATDPFGETAGNAAKTLKKKTSGVS